MFRRLSRTFKATAPRRVPPAAVIFSLAAALNAWAETFTAFVSSPLPRILIPSFMSLTILLAISISGEISVRPSSSICARLSTANSTRNGSFLKPRFGRRRARGVCPPSNTGPFPHLSGPSVLCVLCRRFCQGLSPCPDRRGAALFCCLLQVSVHVSSCLTSISLIRWFLQLPGLHPLPCREAS